MEIQRDLFGELEAHLDQKEITLLIGPRQAGKTTLLRGLIDQLKRKGFTCLLFNLDIDTDAQFFTSQSRFLERVEVMTGGRRAYIFIDEVQRIENAGLFLKGLYDRDLPYKLIATGSGSLELKEKIAESLVGRKRSFYLPTVSIMEFLQYKIPGHSRDTLIRMSATDPVTEDRLLREYLTFGGYPRVVTASGKKEKNIVLTEIFQGYIERDIQILLQLEKSRSFVSLLQILANRIGQLINYNDLARLTGLSQPTLKNYLWYSEKTFLTESITPFFRNKEKEIVKSPQYYFVDSGMRNYLLGISEINKNTQDFSFLFQQLVLQLLKRRFQNSVASFHYWRTQNQAEVDFVVNLGSRLLPVEVKEKNLKSPEISRSLRSFIDHYQPPEAWIINRSLEESIKIDSTDVRFLPWFHLLE